MTGTALAEENARLKACLAETEAAFADAVAAQRRLESTVSALRCQSASDRALRIGAQNKL